MRAIGRVVALFAAAVAACAGHAQTLLDTTLTLGKQPDAVVVDFQAPTGSYRITVTDFGTPAGPVRMARVDAAVTSGSQAVTTLNVTSANSTGTASKTFTAAAGEHRLILVGQPATSARVGSAGVRIDDPASGVVLLDTVLVFTVPPTPVASPADLEHELAVPAGVYTLETTDFALPQPLAVLHTTVVRKSDGSVLAFQVPASSPIALTAGTAETFEVFAHAELAAGVPRGLVGINLRDTATGSTQAAELHELGQWPYRYAFDVAAATMLTATLNELGFPFVLTAPLAAEVVHEGRRAAPRLTAPASESFAADAGAYSIYVNAVPAATGPGSFGLVITPPAPAGTLVEKVQSVVTPAAATDVGTIDAFFDIATAGDYTLTLTDFGTTGFFDAFTSLNLALTRDHDIVDTLGAPGSFTFAAVPGRYHVAIVADPAGAVGEGLLGVRVRGGVNDAIVFDRTEAVGADFIASTVDVASAQSVDVRLTDLGFPASFSSVKVAVTRGAERVGAIVGAGMFSFQATPGSYLVNLLATPAATLGYGTLGLNVSVTPGAPVVTLSASSASVTVGGNVTLTWNAVDAASCVASGGWSGARATSGSVSSGALNTNTAFTLTCTGPGGGDAATVNVTVTAAQRSGGGAADAWLLAMLAVAAAVCSRRRTAERAARA